MTIPLIDNNELWTALVELRRVTRQRDALLAACREALEVFNGPNYGGAPGTTLAVHSIRSAIRACEETT